MSKVLGLIQRGAFYWFPTLYCYYDGLQETWVRLKSKKYCEKIMPLFGAASIDELKRKVISCTFDEKVHYAGFFDRAPVISDSIKIESIATLN